MQIPAIICYILALLIFLVTFVLILFIMKLREKNTDGKYVYFNGSLSIAAAVFFCGSIIAILSIIAQQIEGKIGVKYYYSFIFLLPFMTINFWCIFKALFFKIEIKKNSIFIRGTFGKTRQFAFSHLQIKRVWHLLVAFYYDGKKYIYLANSVLTPGIEELYLKIIK